MPIRADVPFPESIAPGATIADVRIHAAGRALVCPSGVTLRNVELHDGYVLFENATGLRVQDSLMIPNYGITQYRGQPGGGDVGTGIMLALASDIQISNTIVANGRSNIRGEGVSNVVIEDCSPASDVAMAYLTRAASARRAE